MSASTPSSASDAEAHAEQARAGLVGTLNQLRENLKPANMVEEVMNNAKVGASTITDQLWETARKNPVPALLIGAGVAMIFGFGQRAASSSRPQGWASAPDGSPTDRAMRGRDSSTLNDHRPLRSPSPSVSTGSALRTSLNDGRDRAAGLIDDARSHLSSLTASSTDAVTAGVKRRSTKETDMSNFRSRDRLGSTLTRLIDEQPLVLAALGLAVGAAIGAAVPLTEAENTLMGESSGSVRDAAQEMARERYEQLKSAAGHAVEDIKQSAADHGVSTDNLADLVHDVADKAKTATYEAGKTIAP
ncbi:hypothetical protein [Lichenihabitans psoromatis]|uniref:hypothetical protein n=1 Tax=Lichenihabitans psoromatis TaxID=2528642 RepID=UPI0010364DA8|nr:hypothetical protein [Lichenihabitans psoromatis]